MRLTLQSRLYDDVVVIRCQGRIAAGPEADALQNEFNCQTRISGSGVLLVKKVILQLAETDFIDSSGLGALVQMSGVLKAAGGELKLCELSPFVRRVLEVTNLLTVFAVYAAEKEAMAAFSAASPASGAKRSSGAGILCIDPSGALLSYIGALLKRAGYTVWTTRNPGEIMTLAAVNAPKLVLAGPGVPGVPVAVEALDRLRKSEPGVRILQLPPDFSTAEAGDAGVELVSRIGALLESR
jgi:anti-sigma B factor antagonist